MDVGVSINFMLLKIIKGNRNLKSIMLSKNMVPRILISRRSIELILLIKWLF